MACGEGEPEEEERRGEERRGERVRRAVSSLTLALGSSNQPDCLLALLSSPVQAEPWRMAAWVYQRATFLLANY